jgi:hypothetical protein
VADEPALLPAALASIAPIAFGFAAVHLRMFVESREEFRRRVTLKKKEYAERSLIRLGSMGASPGTPLATTSLHRGLNLTVSTSKSPWRRSFPVKRIR